MKRVHEYIFKLRKVLGLWSGGRTLAAALTLTFICTLTAHGKFKPSVLKHFPTVVFFFLSLSPGHNPECGPDKVTFVHRASDSLCLRLPGCLLACFLLGPLMRSVKPGCPFQPFVLATQFAPRRRISCQFKSQTKCLSPTWLWVCVRVCELSNWKLTLAITNWTLIKCGPRYTSATPTGPGAMRKCNKKVNLIDILLSLWLLFEKLPETGNFFVWLCVCVCMSVS